MAAARPSSSSVVSPIARHDDDEVVAGRALARDPPRDPLDAVGVGDGRAAELLDDEGGRHRGAFYRRAVAATSGARLGRAGVRGHRSAATYHGVRAGGPPMCFDLDSHPPIPPIAGGALDSERLTLTAADGNRLAAFLARAAEPSGAGRRDPPRRPRPPPVLRGARPPVRGARRSTRSRSTTSGGPPASSRRGEAFEYMPHVGADDLGRASAPTSRPASAALRTPAVTGRRRAASSRSGSAWAAGLSFLPATWASTWPGVIGFYGRRRAVRATTRRRRSTSRADRRHRPRALRRRGPGHHARGDRRAFDAALTAAGVDHRLVTYPGAPHSFFDRKADRVRRRERGGLGRDAGVHRRRRTSSTRGRRRSGQASSDLRAGVARLDDLDPARAGRRRRPRRRTRLRCA